MERVWKVSFNVVKECCNLYIASIEDFTSVMFWAEDSSGEGCEIIFVFWMPFDHVFR